MKMTDKEAMSPSTKDAIKYLEGMIFPQDFSPSTLRAVAVNKMAIAAMLAQQERDNPKPLTLDELREMGGEPVWITSPTGVTGVWRVCYGERARRRCGEKVIYFAVGICENISDYGKTWLAYRYNPKEAHT